MMNRVGRIALWAVFTGLVACAAARATTLMHLSVEQMARAAEVVVRARCVVNKAGWEAGEIWTLTSFRIEEVWKGAPPAVINVRLLGGRAGNLTSTVDGVPRFQAGEDVVLFLERTKRGDFSIVSWMQGTFRVRLERMTDQESVVQDTAAFATYDLGTQRFKANGVRSMRLDALREQVAAALNWASGKKP